MSSDPASLRRLVYVDTSVISAAIDQHNPARMEETLRFFDGAASFDLIISEVVTQEIQDTPDARRSQLMLLIAQRCRVVASSDAARSLARLYFTGGAFPPGAVEDALHVAIASIHRSEALVSWNYRHLVRERSRLAVNAVNSRSGLSPITICTPPELV